MRFLTTLARTLWSSGWGILHLTVWTALVVVTLGAGIISLLWIIPGIASRGAGRTTVNAFGWLTWFGPFGLLVTRRAKR